MPWPAPRTGAIKLAAEAGPKTAPGSSFDQPLSSLLECWLTPRELYRRTLPLPRNFLGPYRASDCATIRGLMNSYPAWIALSSKVEFPYMGCAKAHRRSTPERA